MRYQRWTSVGFAIPSRNAWQTSEELTTVYNTSPSQPYIIHPVPVTASFSSRKQRTWPVIAICPQLASPC